MTRDDLARHLYIHAHDDQGAPKARQDAGAKEWDAGWASAKDVADCYARADRMIANGEAPR